MMITEFTDYLAGIDNPEQVVRLKEIFAWIHQEFPTLVEHFAWRQPMFTNHGTFIIAFSVAQKHISIAPEGIVMEQFATEIKQAGYVVSKKMFRILNKEAVNYDLLKKIIVSNMLEKAETTTFWR